MKTVEINIELLLPESINRPLFYPTLHYQTAFNVRNPTPSFKSFAVIATCYGALLVFNSSIAFATSSVFHCQFHQSSYFLSLVYIHFAIFTEVYLFDFLFNQNVLPSPKDSPMSCNQFPFSSLKYYPTFMALFISIIEYNRSWILFPSDFFHGLQSLSSVSFFLLQTLPAFFSLSCPLLNVMVM